MMMMMMKDDKLSTSTHLHWEDVAIVSCANCGQLLLAKWIPDNNLYVIWATGQQAE